MYLLECRDFSSLLGIHCKHDSGNAEYREHCRVHGALIIYMMNPHSLTAAFSLLPTPAGADYVGVSPRPALWPRSEPAEIAGNNP